MKKLVLLAAMLAMALLAAAPALGQSEQEIGQESESAEVDVAFEVSGGEGSYNSQCATPLQFGGSGNLQNGQGFIQNDSEADDIEAGGSSVGISPSTGVECEQKVQQSAAASAAPKAAAKAPTPPPPPPPPPPAPKAATPPAPPPPPPAPAPPALAPKAAEAKAGATEAKAETKAEAPKMEMKKEEKKELPKSGGSGSASLLGLSAGALLVGGGLLARRIVR